MVVSWGGVQVFHRQRKFLQYACCSIDVNSDEREREQQAEGRCTKPSKYSLLFDKRKIVQVKFTLIPIFLLFLLFTSTSLGCRFLLLFFLFVVGSVRPRVYGRRSPASNSFLGCFCRFDASLSFMTGSSIEDLRVAGLGKQLTRCMAICWQTPISNVYRESDEKK